MQSLILTLFSLLACIGQSFAVDTLTVTFPRPAPQPACETQAILIDNQGTLATVYSFGINPDQGSIELNGKSYPLKLIAHDPVSRLTLLSLPKGLDPGVRLAETGNSKLLSADQSLRAKDGLTRFAGVEKLFQGRTLPLALLRFHYEKTGIRPGEPITGPNGEVVALALEGGIGESKAGYALPIEVLQRVRLGKATKGKIQRCWLGLIMDSENTIPTLVGLRPESPASRAGLKRGDVLLSIGSSPIREYADAVNAFYYLRAGQATQVRVMRDTEVLELMVVPEIVPSVSPELDQNS